MPQQLARPPDLHKTRCLSTSEGAAQGPWPLAKMQHVAAATQLPNAAFVFGCEGCRRWLTFSKVAINSLADVTSTTVAPGTMTMPLMSRLISNRGCLTCRQYNVCSNQAVGTGNERCGNRAREI